MPAWLILIIVGLVLGMVLMAIYAPKNEGFIAKFNVWIRNAWAWAWSKLKDLFGKIKTWFRR